MDILAALKLEESRLQRQLKGIQGAIAALNTALPAPTVPRVIGSKKARRKRTLSAAARARISKATKARWAKFRAEKAKKGKQSSRTGFAFGTSTRNRVARDQRR